MNTHTMDHTVAPDDVLNMATAYEAGKAYTTEAFNAKPNHLLSIVESMTADEKEVLTVFVETGSLYLGDDVPAYDPWRTADWLKNDGFLMSVPTPDAPETSIDSDEGPMISFTIVTRLGCQAYAIIKEAK